MGGHLKIKIKGVKNCVFCARGDTLRKAGKWECLAEQAIICQLLMFQHILSCAFNK